MHLIALNHWFAFDDTVNIADRAASGLKVVSVTYGVRKEVSRLISELPVKTEEKYAKY